MTSLKRIWQHLDQHPGHTAWLVFGVSLVVYVLTLAPGLLWGGGDFSTFQTKAYTGQIESNVFGHPLWVILARPFLWLPIRDMAYRANLASAVFAAAALALVFLSARLLTRLTAAALLATGALLVSHTFWTYGVMPKPYSLNTLLLAACLYGVLRWRESQRGKYLYLAALLYGLGPFNHLVLLTSLAGFAVFIVLTAWQQRAVRKHALFSLAFFALGLLPFLALELSPNPNATATNAIGPFLLGLLNSLTVPSRLFIGLGAGVALFLYQFLFLAPIIVVGVWQSWKRDRAASLLLALAALGDIAFLLGATDPGTGGEYVWNLHYYLMLYVICAVWLANGFTALWPRFTRTRLRRVALVAVTLGAPVLIYLIAPTVARPFVSILPGFRQIGGRDNLTYVLWPWKQNETGARPFAENILNALPAHSTLFADYSIWSMLNYLQVVEGARPDVRVVLLPGPGEGQQVALMVAHIGLGNSYLADTNQYYEMNLIQEHFDLIPTGPIYQLQPK